MAAAERAVVVAVAVHNRIRTMRRRPPREVRRGGPWRCKGREILRW